MIEGCKDIKAGFLSVITRTAKIVRAVFMYTGEAHNLFYYIETYNYFIFNEQG